MLLLSAKPGLSSQTSHSLQSRIPTAHSRVVTVMAIRLPTEQPATGIQHSVSFIGDDSIGHSSAKVQNASTIDHKPFFLLGQVEYLHML